MRMVFKARQDLRGRVDVLLGSIKAAGGWRIGHIQKEGSLFKYYRGTNNLGKNATYSDTDLERLQKKIRSNRGG